MTVDAGTEPTGWELQRTMNLLRDDLHVGVAKLERAIEDGLRNAVPREVFEVRMSAVEDRLDQAEASRRDRRAFYVSVMSVLVALMAVFLTVTYH